MSAVTPPQVNFTAGEISPLIFGRPDLPAYAGAARKLRNFLPLPYGPITRRGGTLHVAETKSSGEAWLIRFEFSQEQAYQLEFGTGYIRFYRADAQLSVVSVATAITNGTFASNVTGWSDESNGTGAISWNSTHQAMNVTSAGTTGNEGWAEQALSVAGGDQAKEHILLFRVDGDNHDKLQLHIGTSSKAKDILFREELNIGWHAVAFTPGTGTVYIGFVNAEVLAKSVRVDSVSIMAAGALELPTDYTVDEAKVLAFAQSTDDVYLTHANHHPRRLSRYGDTSWSLVDVPFKDGPFLDMNAVARKRMKIDQKTVGVGRTVTADFAAFKSTDPGRQIRFYDGDNAGWMRITAVPSATTATVDVLAEPGIALDTYFADWRMGAYGTDEGYPAAVTLHDSRLILGGGLTSLPQRWDASITGAYDTFGPGANADDAIARVLGTNTINAIHGLVSFDDLFALTSGAVFRIRPSSSSGSLRPDDAGARRVAAPGARNVLPVVAGTAPLYVHRHGRKLIELGYSLDADNFVGADLTQLAEHLGNQTDGAGAVGFTSLAWQEEPFGVVWGARADGMLLGFTYLRREGVLAWHQHPLGGSYGTPATAAYRPHAVVECVSSSPGADEDELWMIVRRTIDGNTRRYIERLKKPLDLDCPVEDAFYLDSGVTLDNTPAAGLTLSAVTGTGITVTASAGVFASGHVGRYIKQRFVDWSAGQYGRDKDGALVWKTAVAKIAGYTSPTVVTADVVGDVDFPATAIAQGAWRQTVTTVTGLDHLEGETVHIVGDGAHQGTATVAGGTVTLSAPAGTVHVGLYPDAYGELLPPEAGSRQGIAQTKKQRTSELAVLYHRTVGFKIGRPESAETGAAVWDEVAFRSSSSMLDAAQPLFSGVRVVPFPGADSRQSIVAIKQDRPLPCTVQLIVQALEVNEG